MAGFAYTFPWTVIDWTTGELTKNRTDGELLDPETNLPVAVVDANGTPVPLKTGPFGTLEPFTAPIGRGIARFGEVRSLVISDSTLDSSDQATRAAAAAEAAAATVAQIAETATEISYFYRDTNGDIWISATPVLTGGGVPRLNSDGDPVIVFGSSI